MSKETTLSGNYPVETMVETWKPPCLVVSMVVSRGSFLAVPFRAYVGINAAMGV